MADWATIRRDGVLFRDEAALVLNKPPGISVVGERHETDIVRLAADSGETLLPAHRIDKVTSGAVLFARQQRYHGDLTRQFNKRTVAKAYLAVTRTTGLPETGMIDLPLSVGRKSRVRIAAERAAIVSDGGRWSVPDGDVFTHVRTYPSVTAFATVWADHQYTLLVVRPLTGRRHQIRVHLAWIGHELAGDPLFDRSGRTPRTLLHSWRLGFTAEWLAGRRIDVAAPPGADFWAPLGDRPPAVDTVLARAADRLAPLSDLVPDPSAVDERVPSED
ncbi:MAG TPA: RluA family pseudouridine synthase [Pseudonocardiaceae bacterium]|nr:RluA family pseudouridine synthase [Pseudonocardiaceae bacterium]